MLQPTCCQLLPWCKAAFTTKILLLTWMTKGVDFLKGFITWSTLQDTISWRSCLFAVCAFLTITSLITAGHFLEDEVIHSEMFTLM
jgi:hypothetical protein